MGYRLRNCSLTSRAFICSLMCISYAYCANSLSFDIQDYSYSTTWNQGYTYARHQKSLDNAYIEFQVGIPIPTNTPGEYIAGHYTNQTALLPDKPVEMKQNFTSSLAMGIPFLDGLAYINYGENQSIGLNSVINSSSMTLDTTVAGNGTILLNASMSSNLSIFQEWKTLKLGYILQSTKNMRVSFALNKHWFNIWSESAFSGNLTGTLSKNNSNGYTHYSLSYSDNNYSGRSNSSYKGESWSPELSLTYRMFRFELKMATEIKLTGHANLEHTTPYVINNLSLNPAYTSIEQLLEQESLLLASSNATLSNNYKTDSPMSFKTPHFYTFDFEVIEQKLFISYTKTSGSFEITLQKDSTDSISPYDTRRFAAFKTSVDHIALIRAHFQYGFIVSGLYELTTSSPDLSSFTTYYQKENIIQSFENTTYVPLMYGGIHIGKKNRFNIELHLLPVTQLKLGVLHEF